MTEQEKLSYFTSNIFLARISYNAWKSLRLSKNEDVAGINLLSKNMEVFKKYPNYFSVTEYSLLICWVTQILHTLDHATDSLSLRKINKAKLDKFLKDSFNDSFYKNLKNIRDKLFAHRQKNYLELDLKIPPIIQVDLFFDNIEKLFSIITQELNETATSFLFTKDVIKEIELIIRNLERGEIVRLNEIKEKYNLL